MISLIYLTVFVFIFAMFNAYVILWQQNTQKKRKLWSKIWHITGRIIIGLVALWEFYWLEDKSIYMGLIYFLTVFNLSWTVWDLSINWIRKINGTKIKLLYIDNGINRKILDFFMGNRTVFWILRLILIVSNVVLLFIQ